MNGNINLSLKTKLKNPKVLLVTIVFLVGLFFVSYYLNILEEVQSYFIPVNNNDVVRAGMLTITIGPQLVDCKRELPTYLEEKCFELKGNYFSDGNPGVCLNTIENFDYEPGYEYVIKVRIRPSRFYENEPTGEKWFYLETIKKQMI